MIYKFAANKFVKMLNSKKLSEKAIQKLKKFIPEAEGLQAVNWAGKQNAMNIHDVRKEIGNKAAVTVRRSGAEALNGETSYILAQDPKDAWFKITVPDKGANKAYGKIPMRDNAVKELRGYTAYHEISGEMPTTKAIHQGLRDSKAAVNLDNGNAFNMSTHGSPAVPLHDTKLTSRLSKSSKNILNKMDRHNIAKNPFNGGIFSEDGKKLNQAQFLEKTVTGENKGRFRDINRATRENMINASTMSHEINMRHSSKPDFENLIRSNVQKRIGELKR